MKKKTLKETVVGQAVEIQVLNKFVKESREELREKRAKLYQAEEQASQYLNESIIRKLKLEAITGPARTAIAYLQEIDTLLSKDFRKVPISDRQNYQEVARALVKELREGLEE